MNKVHKIMIAVFIVVTSLFSSLYIWSSLPPKFTGGLHLTQKWPSDLDNEIKEISTTAYGSLVLARTNGSVYGLLSNTGEAVWQFNSSSQVELSPALSVSGNIFITDNKALWALKQENGSVIWSQLLPETRGWVVDASDDVVLVNERSNDLRAYSTKTGQLLWGINVGAGYTKAYIDIDKVYIPDYGIKSVDLLTGQAKWSNGDNAIGWSEYQDGVIYYTSGEYIFAYDARNRSEIWKVHQISEGFRKFKIYQNVVIVTDADYIYIFEKENGNLQWKARLDYPVNPTPLGDNLYVMEGFKKVIQVLDIATGNKVGSITISLPQLFLVDHQNLTSSKELLLFSKGKILYAYEE